MKEIKLVLKKIVLKDWKGLNLEVEFNKGKTVIKGQNGIGKSSIIHAHNWMWSGYTDSNSNKNSELFDNTKTLDQNTPIASVKEFITLDGYDYTIERTAQAKFVRRRGSNEYEKAPSDVYTTKIDDVETSATDFNKWIERNICSLDLLPFLLDGSFFTNLTVNDKQKARKVLEKIVGEIKDEDLSGDYAPIIEKMKRYSLDEIKNQTKNQIKPLKDSLDDIKAVIESKENLLSSYKQSDFEMLLSDINVKKAEIDRLDKSIMYASEAIKPIADERAKITNEVNDLLSKMGDERIAYDLEYKKKIAELNEKKKSIESTNARYKKEMDDEQKVINEASKKRKEINKLIEKTKEDICYLRDELKSIKERIFTDTTCAYCGQELPEDKLTEAKERFNKRKQIDYDNCVLKGKAAKDELDSLNKKLDEVEKIIFRGVEGKVMLSADKIDKEIAKVESDKIPFEDTEAYKKTMAAVEALKLRMPIIPAVDNSALLAQKESIMDELETLNRQYGRKDDMDRLEKEVDTHKQDLNECAIKIAELEGLLDMIKAYESERAQIVSDRINSKLDGCQVFMWSILKSGERVEDCVLADLNGVKYATKNNSDRIKMCTSIQRMFCRHFKIILPIMIDEASVFDSKNLPSFESQAVYMYASDDKQLIVQ